MELLNKFKLLTEIGTALSSEKDIIKLLNMIVLDIKNITDCDGATLYLFNEINKTLNFQVVYTDSLNIMMSGDSINWPELQLYFQNGQENREMVAVVSSLDKKIINIQDVYHSNEYNFEGTKKFDKSTGYRSKSMLVIPILDQDKNLVGVLQLINKIKDNKTIPFDKFDEIIALSIASQAGIAIKNRCLINELEKLLESFIVTIGKAIDAKSQFTGDHVRKVAKLSLMLADELNKNLTKFKKVKYRKNDYRKIKISAWLHDIGKITVPETLLNKARKLEVFFDRIILIEERFEKFKLQEEVKFLRNIITEDEYKKRIAQYDSDLEFLKFSNIGTEFMNKDNIARVINLEKSGKITKDESLNLQIKKGTLTEKERQEINSHAIIGLEMLQSLNLPRDLAEVTDIAGNHHEKLNGKGYPRGLKADELSIEDRLLGIADIFEAITSSNRPYREPNKLSEAFKILSFMVKDGELDGDIIRFFYESGIYLKYAKEELKESQIDVENIKLLF